MGVPVVPADLESVHRVPVATQPGNKNTVVQFAHRHLRDKFFEEGRSRRLHCSDLGFDTQAPVFVNEHLCPVLKRLLGTRPYANEMRGGSTSGCATEKFSPTRLTALPLSG